MTIEAVLFDFDGTLADTLPLSFEAFKTIFRKYEHRDVTVEELVGMFGPTEDQIIAANFSNLHMAAAAADEYYAIYRQGHSESVRKHPGIIDLLTFIKGRGIKIGVVTGKSRTAFQISAEALQLSGFFEAVITGDDVEKPKPDPEGIDKAVNILGVNKASAVFLGDSNADIGAGKAAGIRTYGVHWLPVFQSPEFDIPPDAVFAKVSDFVQLLQEQAAPVRYPWLDWAKQIQAIAQSGLTYAKDVYDRERYEQLRELSVEILSQYTSVPLEQIQLAFASDSGYATPKVDIRGVIFRDREILLVREKMDGAWSLPGGWADIGLSPSEIVVKEVKEEAGIDVKPVRLLAVMDKKFHGHPPEPYHIYKMFILCEMIGGEAKGGVETSEAGFFAEDGLPELSLERNTAKQIQTMFEFLRHPERDTLLD